MTKLKNPLLSLEAHGSLGDSLTFVRRAKTTVAEKKPALPYFLTLPARYQRWLYSDYAHNWTLQSQATKQLYASLGVRYHLTGFQYFMSYHLGNMPDIVAIYHLDPVSTNTIEDSSKNSNDGTTANVSMATGLVDGAYSFNGVSSICTINDTPTLNIDLDFCFSFFFYNAHLAGWQILLNKGAAVGTREFTLRMNAADQFHILLGNLAGNWGLNWNTAWVPTINTWYHVAVLRRTNIVYLYVDGSFLARIFYADHIKDSAQPLLLGGDNAGSWYNGLIDHLIIYSRSLSDSEIVRQAARRWPA